MVTTCISFYSCIICENVGVDNPCVAYIIFRVFFSTNILKCIIFSIFILHLALCSSEKCFASFDALHNDNKDLKLY